MPLHKTFFVSLLVGLLARQAPAQPTSSDRAADRAQQAGENDRPTRPSLLLIQEGQHPRITVSWVSGGETRRYTDTMPFSAPVGGEALGESNVRVYAALGGTRIETGAGHPRGAVVRVGLTKIDNSRAFFAGIDPGTEIEITIHGVRFNQPVKYHAGTGMMHLKYALGDLEACELPAEARNQYLLSDPRDTLGGRVIAGENATPGALGGGEGNGRISIEVHADDPTLADLRITVPYGLLRHLQDPWQSKLPGTFFEPIHLHAEAEMIPIDAEPLDREPILPERNPTRGSTDSDD